jgi:cytochrome b
MSDLRRRERPLTGPRKPREIRLSMKVWDAPVRLFHWAIVLLVIISYVSIQKSWMQIHFLSGYAMLTLLLFRLAWGFVGSETARFGAFLRNPLRALEHLVHFGRREPDTEIGHNAAGGWMVLVLLLLLAVQVGTGLCSNDDVLSEGPLSTYVGKALSDRISGWHAFNFNLILAAIGLHVLAVLAYWVVKRHNLLRPMITGRKRLPGNMRQPRMASSVLALALLILAAMIVWTFVSFA